MEPPIITLTDFGTHDPFVGIMKGVILGINRRATIIDLTHKVPPGDLSQAAITLWSSSHFFPIGSIFLTVVDPGVGTERKPVIIQTTEHILVGPDNGVFTYVLGREYRAWSLSNPDLMLPSPGTTFHGRDIFAPAAAHASLGVPGPDFGPVMPHLTQLKWPSLTVSMQNITGEILHADHFGNILTSLGIFSANNDGTYQLNPWTGETKPVVIDLKNARLKLPNQVVLSWAPTFGSIPEDRCAMILGSTGLLEIAANRQSAWSQLNLERGDQVELEIPILTSQ